MTYYCGIDLYSNNHYVCVIDENDNRIWMIRKPVKGLARNHETWLDPGHLFIKLRSFRYSRQTKTLKIYCRSKGTKDSRRERHSVRWHQLHKGNSVSVKYLEVEQPEPHEVCRALQLILTPNKCFHMPRNALQCPC